MKRNWFGTLCGVGVIGAMASAAFAHPGHPSTGLAAGIAHPFTGLDHLLTMIAVGMWSAQVQMRRRWAIPAAFLLFMAVGAGVASAAPVIGASAIDQLVAASLLVSGLLLAGALRLRAPVCFTLVALFALFHGYAHGLEGGTGLSGAQYEIGFLAATSLLLAAGVIAAELLTAMKKPLFLRFAGGACVLAALLMLGGAL